MTQKKRIAVIGVGAAGLAVLKVFLEQPQVKDRLWTITAYEAREGIGGIWLPAPGTVDPPPKTPLYDSLTTNLPHPLMGFQSLLFPPSTPLFPPASAVLAYLRSYAHTFGLNPHVRLRSPVENVRWTGSAWEVTISTEQQVQVHYYDVVVVSNGHYSLPRYPSQPGFAAWRALPGPKVIHSISYRRPAPYRGKTVLVLGSGPSGSDIAAEVATLATRVYHASTPFAREDSGNVSKRGRPTEFLTDGKTVLFADGSSASDIDLVISATGYTYSLGFLPPSVLRTAPDPSHLWTSGQHVYPLAMHVFPLTPDYPPTSLAFVGLPYLVIPFPIFEAQTRAICKALAFPSSFSVPEQRAAVERRQADLLARANGDLRQVARDWHRLPENEQFDYRTEVLAFAGEKKWAVEPWAREELAIKGELRNAWREIERRGEAEEWLSGVGRGGINDWVDLMRRLREWGKSHLPADGLVKA